MSTHDSKPGAATDRFDLHDATAKARTQTFAERVKSGAERQRQLTDPRQPILLRQHLRGDGREVEMIDRISGQPRKLLNFGSNNYLALATHPYVRQKVHEAIDAYGVGTPGPPVFNGYGKLHRELEERLAALKGMEDALLFSSGYAANVGIVGSMVTERDSAIFDQLSHASLWDGLKLSGTRSFRTFRHNDVSHLEGILKADDKARDKFVAIEGIYSMDGDAPPLRDIVNACRRHNAVLILDDAHATGVLGDTGRGSAEHFGVEGEVDLVTATLGKAFGVMGAFAAGSRDLIAYLRLFARSYVFSTALPPAVVAAVLAGMEVLEREPHLRVNLRSLVRRAASGLRPCGLVCEPQAALIAVRVPAQLDIQKAIAAFERLGIFLNYVIFPAVAVNEQRFRVSLTAAHTEADVDKLIAAFQEVWSECLAA